MRGGRTTEGQSKNLLAGGYLLRMAPSFIRIIYDSCENAVKCIYLLLNTLKGSQSRRGSGRTGKKLPHVGGTVSVVATW